MKPTLEAMERPIIMAGESVRAILDDRKTQTRVPIGLGTLKPSETPGYDWTFRGRAPIRSIAGQRRHQHGCWQDLSIDELLALCPHGAVGDHLWVKETWCLAHPDYHTEEDGRNLKRPLQDGRWCHYAATDDVEDNDGKSPWRSPLFMPRWASRITLEIVDVRVQRVQDISEVDARAEGCRDFFEAYPRIGRDQRLTCGALASDSPCRAFFACLWDSINAKRTPWATNPWVWVLTFRRVS